MLFGCWRDRWCRCGLFAYFNSIASQLPFHAAYGTKSQWVVHTSCDSGPLQCLEVALSCEKAQLTEKLGSGSPQTKASASKSLQWGEPRKAHLGSVGAGREFRLKFHQDLCLKSPKSWYSLRNILRGTIWSLGPREGTFGRSFSYSPQGSEQRPARYERSRLQCKPADFCTFQTMEHPRNLRSRPQCKHANLWVPSSSVHKAP